MTAETVEEALKAVRDGDLELKDMPEALRTEEVCMAAVKRNGAALEWVPDRLKTEEVCLAAVKSGGWALEWVPDALLGFAVLNGASVPRLEELAEEDWTADACRLAVFRYPEEMAFVPDALKDRVKRELEAVRRAAREDWWDWRCGADGAPAREACATHEFWLAALKRDPEMARDWDEDMLVSMLERFPDLRMEAVRQDGYALDFIPEALRTEDICMEAAARNGAALKLVPADVKTQGMCRAALISCMDFLRWELPRGVYIPEFYGAEQAPEALRKSPSLMEAADRLKRGGTEDGWALRRMPDAEKTLEACWTAVRNCPLALAYVPERLLTPGLCMDAAAKDGCALAFVPDAMKTADICGAAAKQNPWSMHFVPQKLRRAAAKAAGLNLSEAPALLPDRGGDENFWLHAVHEEEWELWRVPDRYRLSGTCIAALAQDGEALAFAPQSACMEAVRLDGRALCFVPEGRRTKDMCMAAVKQDGWALVYAPEDMRTQDICMEAVGRDGLVLQFVPDRIRTAELCAAAVRQEPEAMKHVPSRIRSGVERLLVPSPDAAPEKKRAPKGGDGVLQEAATRFAAEAADAAARGLVPEGWTLSLDPERLEDGRLKFAVSAGRDGGERMELMSAVYRTKSGKAPSAAKALETFAGKIERGGIARPELRDFCLSAYRRACGMPEPELIDDTEAPPSFRP